MALRSSLLLLLVVHSVSSVERHSLYHIYTLHYSSSQTPSNITEFTPAVLIDGKRISSDDGFSGDEKQTFLHEFKVFIHLLEVSPDEDQLFTQRYGCEIERSPSGDVTLLNTTAEYRRDRKTILYYSFHTARWEAVDQTFLPVPIGQNRSLNFSQTSKDYLLRGCTNILLSYLSNTTDVDGPDQESSCPSVLTPVLVIVSIIALMAVVIYMVKRLPCARRSDILGSARDFGPLTYSQVNEESGYEFMPLPPGICGSPRGFCPPLEFPQVNEESFYDCRILSEDRLTTAGKTEGEEGDRHAQPNTQNPFLPPVPRGATRSMDIPPTLGLLSSKTISLPAFETEGEEGDRHAQPNLQNLLLPPVPGGAARSMDIPPTLAENDGQRLREDRLTPAGGRCHSKSLSLPNLAVEKEDGADAQQDDSS